MAHDPTTNALTVKVHRLGTTLVPDAMARLAVLSPGPYNTPMFPVGAMKQ